MKGEHGETFDSTLNFLDRDDALEERPPRFPIRWRWALLVGFAVAVSVFFLFMLILDMERDAWLDSQASQADVLVGRLADELKIPMLAGSSAEVDVIVSGFLEKVPSVLGIYLHYATGEGQYYGSLTPAEVHRLDILRGKSIQALPADRLWYAKDIKFADTTIGQVKVRFSEQAWEDLASGLMHRMGVAALVVVLLSSFLVYWIARRMSRPLEMLANSARHVAYGDYSVRLPVQGNDEISDAVAQFNAMVAELAHKEDLRNVMGRYLNPKLVSDVFSNTKIKPAKAWQEVTVLFADMVQFTSFSESTSTEEVVEVLNKHFEVFHRIIDYYGGHVDKYIGDAVMAVFNHPNEDPEHVRHAALAALAMSMACTKLGVLRANGEPISFRFGLNCGKAIVGNIGAAERLEYTVIGDTVNVASRMSALGEGGQVVLPQASFDRLGDGFKFDSIGLREIKGVREPINCGVLRPVGAETQRNIAHAVALAFDLTLPSGVRQTIGDVDAS